MVYRYSHIKLIRLAGLIIWFSLSVPLFLHFEIFNSPFIVYLSAHLGFGLVFWAITHNIGQISFKLKAWASVSLLAFVVILIDQVTNSAIGIVYALIISVLLPWFFSIKESLSILLAINILLALQFQFIGEISSNPLVHYMLFFVYLGASAFSFIISLVAFRQQNAKEELRMLNTELRATQVLLADSSRINERLRISRELHDLIGHHLTALTLNLEAASHMTEGKPQSYVKKAHSIARLLLSDVREVVGQFRQAGTLDLGQAVSELLAGLPSLKVRSEIPDEFLVEDPKCAQTILRCTQELITNTMKHAHASEIFVKLEKTNHAIILEVKDNGVGLKGFKAGNGLTGITERVKMLNGNVTFTSNGGTQTVLTFPY